jgi:UDP-N-acetylglucosamine 2-epimerase (non-hydrolysing)
VVHLEAGARAFDRFMPEELNRIVVDHVSALLLAADEVAHANLRQEGCAAERIRIVGSTAIDAVEQVRDRLDGSTILERLGLEAGTYVAVTAHRAKNTAPDVLPGLLAALGAVAVRHRLVFPLHPRTRAAMAEQGLRMPPGIVVTDPLGYFDTLRLVRDSVALLTDSGGLQEESAALGTPTLILRFETEWEYLVKSGAHKLVGNTPDSILDGAERWLSARGLAEIRATPAPTSPGAALRAVDAMLTPL